MEYTTQGGVHDDLESTGARVSNNLHILQEVPLENEDFMMAKKAMLDSVFGQSRATTATPSPAASSPGKLAIEDPYRIKMCVHLSAESKPKMLSCEPTAVSLNTFRCRLTKNVSTIGTHVEEFSCASETVTLTHD
jgi:hypothetical protein